MSTTQIFVTVLVVLVVAALAAGAWYVIRSRGLRDRFGPEYDRAVEESGSKTAAERELRDRERRHAQLELRELTPEARAGYTAEWEQLQTRFLDAPEDAATAADDLVTRLIADRGYPTGDYDEQLAQLSVEHARTIGSYREAHDITLRNQRGEATTEQLRQAVIHYRELVAELLGTVDRTEGADHAPHANR